mmetsp:Transcript_51166/g.87687  ORF Transcript_51166/g.87687 Transcript_51166/m.87687 type:complete len:270 (-) Transcript_51166:1484-2293(-)
MFAAEADWVIFCCLASNVSCSKRSLGLTHPSSTSLLKASLAKVFFFILPCLAINLAASLSLSSAFIWSWYTFASAAIRRCAGLGMPSPGAFNSSTVRVAKLVNSYTPNPSTAARCWSPPTERSSLSRSKFFFRFDMDKELSASVSATTWPVVIVKWCLWCFLLLDWPRLPPLALRRPPLAGLPPLALRRSPVPGVLERPWLEDPLSISTPSSTLKLNPSPSAVLSSSSYVRSVSGSFEFEPNRDPSSLALGGPGDPGSASDTTPHTAVW